MHMQFERVKISSKKLGVTIGSVMEKRMLRIPLLIFAAIGATLDWLTQQGIAPVIIAPGLAHSLWIVGFLLVLSTASVPLLIHTSAFLVNFLIHGRRAFRILLRCILLDWASETSATRWLLFFIPAALISIIISTYFSILLYIICLGIYLITESMQFFIGRISPPFCLFLGASAVDEEFFHLQPALSLNLWPLRIVSILPPDAMSFLPSKKTARLDSYRTFDDLWPDMLRDLIEIAPFIVIDYRTLTGHVEYELSVICSCNMLYKCLFVVPEEEANGRPFMVLESSGDGIIQTPCCKVTPDESITMIFLLFHFGGTLPTPTLSAQQIRERLVTEGIILSKGTRE
jgi:hypothetical protein